jgi:hypothetical protein
MLFMVQYAETVALRMGFSLLCPPPTLLVELNVIVIPEVKRQKHTYVYRRFGDRKIGTNPVVVDLDTSVFVAHRKRTAEIHEFVKLLISTPRTTRRSWTEIRYRV